MSLLRINGRTSHSSPTGLIEHLLHPPHTPTCHWTPLCQLQLKAPQSPIRASPFPPRRQKHPNSRSSFSIGRPTAPKASPSSQQHSPEETPSSSYTESLCYSTALEFPTDFHSIWSCHCFFDIPVNNRESVAHVQIKENE